ncbi:uncharacterized protein I303_107816 [Kwoniella dejecticola CBS 10117]|uniref:Uncharacterized protein n=1 Tax=Kwoniella dejecticola CBS 10117 TaxID=1296121 RepID=A0A1A5ZVS6_9TREE|nr:uncharacterized protein I303_07819 [Kwoniella dejecticola CBS 10117]OBR81909.1 hypothetical protein I303_07819 [Kwoniella dejecticola CBS 10117]
MSSNKRPSSSQEGCGSEAKKVAKSETPKQLLPDPCEDSMLIRFNTHDNGQIDCLRLPLLANSRVFRNELKDHDWSEDKVAWLELHDEKIETRRILIEYANLVSSEWECYTFPDDYTRLNRALDFFDFLKKYEDNCSLNCVKLSFRLALAEDRLDQFSPLKWFTIAGRLDDAAACERVIMHPRNVYWGYRYSVTTMYQPEERVHDVIIGYHCLDLSVAPDRYLDRIPARYRNVLRIATAQSSPMGVDMWNPTPERSDKDWAIFKARVAECFFVEINEIQTESEESEDEE